MTLLPILALFFFGGETLQDFAFALLVGIVIGAYSSFFVASPLLCVLKRGEPEYRGRPGSDELPAFMLGKVVTEEPRVAVAVAADSPAPAVEEAATADPEAPGTTATSAATGAPAGPDDAAIEAARQRRANRRGKKRS